MRHIILGVCLGFMPGFVLATPSSALQLQQRLSHLKTFQADFMQTLTQAGHTQTQSGYVLIQKPGQFVWAVQKPHIQTYVSDGKALWQYDQQLNQVIVRQLATGLSQTPIALLTAAQPLSRLYVVKTVGSNRFQLTAKQPGAVMQSVTLRFAQQQLVGMSLQNALHQTTRVKFQHVRYNQSVSPKTFHFKAPQGADVVHV